MGPLPYFKASVRLPNDRSRLDVLRTRACLDAGDRIVKRSMSKVEIPLASLGCLNGAGARFKQPRLAT